MAFKKGNIPWNKGDTGLKPWMNTDGLKLGQQAGNKHHLWKGDNAGYSAIHYWIYRQLGKAKKCSNCGSIKKCGWANISGKYLRDIKDYKPLCYSCHSYFDDMLTKAWNTRKGVASCEL